jgi:hypothetical protein
MSSFGGDFTLSRTVNLKIQPLHTARALLLRIALNYCE